MLSSISSFIKKFTQKLSSALAQFLGHAVRADAVDRAQLRKLLLQADITPSTADVLLAGIEHAQADVPAAQVLADTMRTMLQYASSAEPIVPGIIFMVGINGAGKTSTCVKLAAYHAARGLRVAIAAADTFRAAAQDQLLIYAQRAHIPVISGQMGKDPGTVVYAAAQAYKNGLYDLIIIDTAGRLQTKDHLMKELARLYAIVSKQCPEVKQQTLLVIDAMLGSNSLDQARIFSETITINGLIVTKCDGGAKGGMVLSITHELHVPVVMMTFGERIEDIRPFDADQFIQSILS